MVRPAAWTPGIVDFRRIRAEIEDQGEQARKPLGIAPDITLRLCRNSTMPARFGQKSFDSRPQISAQMQGVGLEPSFCIEEKAQLLMTIIGVMLEMYPKAV